LLDLREIYRAPTRAGPQATIEVFADKYNAKHDKAVACRTKDREALLASSISPPSTEIICLVDMTSVN
jgi:hypothetical protein